MPPPFSLKSPFKTFFSLKSAASHSLPKNSAPISPLMPGPAFQASALFCQFSSGVAPANQTRKGPKRKVHEFAHFCKFWCFSLGKQARFTSSFCSGLPSGKVHELAFLWFGLPGWLLISMAKTWKSPRPRPQDPCVFRCQGHPGDFLNFMCPFLSSHIIEMRNNEHARDGFVSTLLNFSCCVLLINPIHFGLHGKELPSYPFCCENVTQLIRKNRRRAMITKRKGSGGGLTNKLSAPKSRITIR